MEQARIGILKNLICEINFIYNYFLKSSRFGVFRLSALDMFKCIIHDLFQIWRSLW